MVHVGGDGFPMHTDGKQPLSLEGIFYKYFDVFVTTGQETETLELLTPDIMEEFIAHASRYHIEMVDDKIYIVYGDVITELKELQTMFELAKKVSERMAFFHEKKKETWLQESTMLTH
jgi:hypothetical protein